MTVYKKTDNHDPKAKLNLRRYFLEKYYPAGTAKVLDCCQGSGFIWNVLQKEFSLAEYVGLDVKPKKGRLKIDSVRYLQAGKWCHNFIDIDTYGSPWKHWLAVLKERPENCTVCLTIGFVRMGGGRLCNEAINLMNLPKITPISLTGKLHELSISYCLTACYKYNMIAVEAVEAASNGNARYIGVRIKRG